MKHDIIHLNIANFSVAVEQLLDSSLRAKPLIIAPRIPRATVYDMSEEAYQEGVRKNMPLMLAQKICRRATIVPPSPARYEKAIQQCIRRALPFTPQVEQASGTGHLYLDVTGTRRLLGSPPDIGGRLRTILRRDLGFTPIWSVGSSKLVAKVASRIVKPTGEYIVAAGKEREFLAPLPLYLLPSADTKIILRLREVGIRCVAQAAALSLQDLSLLCGQRTEQLYHNLRGIDHTPVRSQAEAGKRFFFHQHCTANSNRTEIIRTAVLDLARKAARSLRKQKLGCRRIGLSLLYCDGVTVDRQGSSGTTLISHDQELEELAITVLFRCWRRRVQVQTITLNCSRTAHPVCQLSLLGSINKKQQKKERLTKAVDIVQSRFGSAVLSRGSLH